MTTVATSMAKTRKSSRQRQPKPERIAALELIAGCGPLGMSEAIMQENGLTLADMIELVRSGLAAAICERVVEDRLTVTHVRLTEAGQRVLAKAKR
jgi:hypothetical protein